MLEKCTCGTPLINGIDSKLQIEYPPEKLMEFAAGLLSIEQLNEHAKIFYIRPRLCPYPECINFAGDPNNKYKNIIHKYNENGVDVEKSMRVPSIDYNNPRVVLEQLKIYDE